MFERYTESAKRVLFFARYEVSHLGATQIATEHILLGLIREAEGLPARLLGQFQVSLETIRRDVEARSVFREKTGTSVEVPFSAETKRALLFAAEEADGLRHDYIGTEHVLLGLLREETTVAGSILASHGMHADDVRNSLVTMLAEPSSESGSSTRAGVAEQIQHIKHLVEQLARLAPDSNEARSLADRIFHWLNDLDRQLGR